MLTWKILTKSIYNNLPNSEKSFDKLFYLIDTKEIFCGLSKFTESIVVYKNNPTTHASGRVYINGDTLEGKIWSNSKWINIINPVKTISNGEIDSTNIKSISYITKNDIPTISLLMNDNSINTINLENFILELVYINDGDYISIDIDNVYGIISENNKSVDLYKFIDIDINENTVSIIFNDIIIKFSIDEILKNYTNKSHIPITITGNGFISDSILYSNKSNISILVEDDLYITTNANKINDISLFSINENSDTALSTSEELSTDVIAQVRAALQDTIGDKMLKVGTGYTGEILTADSDGNAYPSGVKIKRDTITTGSLSNKFVPTEKGIVEYINANTINKNKISTSDHIPTSLEEASDTKIASEKALVKVMSWNVI